MFKKLYHIALRECGIMWKNPIYLFCMVIFPIVVVIFFTTLMKGGVPTDMPVGIVDQDNSATSRQLVHKLDAFQTTKVVAHYENMAEARHAIQKNEIYAFLLIPDGTEAGLIAQKQPKISFYYSSVSLAAGSLLFRDLKTISTLGGAAAGMAKLSALGKTNDEIMTFLQPIAVDLHMIGNPYANYNYYLSSVMVPGLIMLFVFLITPYSIGTELKFNRARDWMRMAGNNPYLAIAGKMLPPCGQTNARFVDTVSGHHQLHALVFPCAYRGERTVDDLFLAHAPETQNRHSGGVCWENRVGGHFGRRSAYFLPRASCQMVDVRHDCAGHSDEP